MASAVIIISGTSTGVMSLQSEPPPIPAMRFMPLTEEMRPLTDKPPSLCRVMENCPKPQPQPVAQAAPVSRPSGTRSNGSTNAYVDPWGCEASHAQQWSSSGKYWGKYQFDRQTWAAHGGTNYGSASEAEQDRVAARVKYDAWPNC